MKDWADDCAKVGPGGVSVIGCRHCVARRAMTSVRMALTLARSRPLDLAKMHPCRPITSCGRQALTVLGARRGRRRESVVPGRSRTQSAHARGCTTRALQH
jgi:hypothetical protein